MCTFPSFWFSSSHENDRVTAADRFHWDPSLSQLEQKPILSAPNVQTMEEHGFQIDFTNGFRNLNDDHRQNQTPPDTERVLNEEGLLLNYFSCVKQELLDPFMKKLSHNANERQRRKKLNALFSRLRSLLPDPKRKRKLSIPSTVCRVLKYIPELRNEIEKLGKQRDKLLVIKRLSESPPVTSKAKLHIECQHSHGGVCSPPVVSVSSGSLKRSEVLMTIYACKGTFMLSAMLVLLEREGLEVLDASTFFPRHEVCHIFRLQMTGNNLDMEVLQKKVMFFCESSVASGILH